jgi:hypothetical protein
VDFIKAVYALEPLPATGIFVYQMKMIASGTIGFGIATNSWIDN